MHRAGIDAVGAKDRAHKLGAARAQQAGDPENLAAIKVEGDVVEVPCTGQAAHFEQRREPVDRLARRPGRAGGVAEHHADDLGGRGRAHLDGTDIVAVAYDGAGVGDLEELAHAVRDVDHRHAARPQSLDQREKLLDLFRGERRCRFVKQQDRWVEGHRFDDLDDLLLPDAEG